MLKLECSARDSIIDFIEKSGKLATVRKYYSCLLIHAKFEKQLKEIATLRGENFELFDCILV